MPARNQVLRYLKNKVLKVAKKSRKVLQSAEDAIDAVEDIHDDVDLSHRVSQEADELADSGSDVLNAAVEIPVPVTQELKPAAKGVSAVHKILKNTVVPTLGGVASALGAIAVLLHGIKALLEAFRTRNAGLSASFDHAESVTDQILEKFGDRLPAELDGVLDAMGRAFDSVEPRLAPLDTALDKAQKALKPLDPVLELATFVRPAADAMAAVHRVLKPILDKSAPLLKGLKKAVAAFEKYKKKALDEIEAALKAHHIDISFIRRIDAQIDGLVGKAMDTLLSPIRSLKKQAEDRLKGLEAPIADLDSKLEDVLTHASRALEPLQSALDDYVAAAARLGIHPR
jgi:hypothetical protein